MPAQQKMTFDVRTEWVSHEVSVSFCKDAKIDLDTNLAGNPNAFNPAELLLAALSACMIKGIERVAPMLKFEFSGVEINLHGVRQDVPPKMESIEYEIIIDTNEDEHRLELLHKNVKQYGTVFNTVTAGTNLSGKIRRK
ncbi:MAG TPA: osmotically inducible protein C [Anaerolineae bacterium]|nr:osmotically inducible protein C [Anaerolineae bacterium]